MTGLVDRGQQPQPKGLQAPDLGVQNVELGEHLATTQLRNRPPIHYVHTQKATGSRRQFLIQNSQFRLIHKRFRSQRTTTGARVPWPPATTPTKTRTLASSQVVLSNHAPSADMPDPSRYAGAVF
jgi:hypothetical protein